MNKYDVNYLLKHNSGPYEKQITNIENDIKVLERKNTPKKVDNMGLADIKYWDIEKDRKLLSEEPLIVAKCTQIDHSSHSASINM